MNWLNVPIRGFRSKRKCVTISGTFLLTITMLLAVAPASCRPSEEMYDNGDIDVGDEFADVDNVEWHHVKLVDGVMHEDHPVIMYKEDFVSEDYDPIKHRSSTNKATVSSSHGTTLRRYKDITHRRRRINPSHTKPYRAIKPEKIYFDVLPQAPVVVADDSGANDSKFDPSKIRFEVISLIDDADKQGGEVRPSKQELIKRPKKYLKRSRRDIHVARKRNPYYQTNGDVNSVTSFLQRIYDSMPPQTQIAFRKHHVQGKLWNSLNLPVNTSNILSDNDVPLSFDNRFGGEDETDRVVWGKGQSKRTTTRRPATRRTPPPLFHNANPEDADFSFFTTTRRPDAGRLPVSGRRPGTTRRPPPPLFHDSNPDNADFSFFTQEQQEELARDNNQEASSNVNVYREQSTGNDDIEDGDDTNESELCMQAATSCCERTNLIMRYDCFNKFNCARSISLCDMM